MKYLVGGQIFDDCIREAVYRDTQVEEESVALTAGGVSRLTGAGELDFGGDEYRPADREELEPELRNEEDKYGWWELSPGGYLLQLNEKPELPPRAGAIIQPHEHLLAGGGYHPTLWLSENSSNEELILPLRVNEPGLNIKENARVSQLLIMEG